MEKEFSRDIVDGRIIDWSKLSEKELKSMQAEFRKREKDLLKKIDDELSLDER